MAQTREERNAKARLHMREYGKMHREEKRLYNKTYGESHREEKRAYNSEYRLAHLEERQIYSKEWQAAHSDEVRILHQQWRDSHREQYNETGRRYRANNPIWAIWSGVNALAKKRGVTNRIEFEEFRILWESAGDICPACHRRFGAGLRKRSFDHVQPLSCGGEHSVGNGQIICLGCNSDKRDQTIRYQTTRVRLSQTHARSLSIDL